MTDNVQGTGPRLPEAIRNIINHSLNNINRHLAAKTASAVVASTSSPTEPTNHEHGQLYENVQYYQSANQRPYTIVEERGQASFSDQPQTSHKQGNDHFGYQDPSNGPASYSAVPTFSSASYSSGPASQATMESFDAFTSQPTSQQTSNFIAAFRSPPRHQNGFLPPGPPTSISDAEYQAHAAGGPAAWRHFTNNIMANSPSFMHTTDAIIALQNRTKAEGGMDMGAVPLGLHMPDGPQSWPHIQFNAGSGSGDSQQQQQQ